MINYIIKFNVINYNVDLIMTSESESMLVDIRLTIRIGV